MNKRTPLWILGAFFVGCVVGTYWEKFKHGYHHEVIDQKTVDFPNGKVILTHTVEGLGWQLIDTARNEIVFDDNSGLNFTLYKSQEGFQGGIDAVEEIKVKDHDLEWRDGIYRYRLNMQPEEDEKAGAKK